MYFKAVIFDLDGTLAFTLHDLADSMNQVLTDNNFPVHELDEYRYYVGRGIKNLVFNSLPTSCRDEVVVEKCLDQFLAEYEKRYVEKTVLYPGIAELIELMKTRSIRMAVLSNKKDVFTVKMVERFFSSNTFEMVLGASEKFPAKPNPASALFISESFGLAPAQIMYVGDSNTDMQTAKSAGMIACGVLWGYRTQEELLESGADFIVSQPVEIMGVMNSFQSE